MTEILMMTPTPQLQKTAIKKRASHPSSNRDPDLDFRKLVDPPMFRLCSTYVGLCAICVSTVLDLCFDCSRSVFRLCLNYVSTVHNLYVDRARPLF